jgi:uncharacterized OsmC-like protein
MQARKGHVGIDPWRIFLLALGGCQPVTLNGQPKPQALMVEYSTVSVDPTSLTSYIDSLFLYKNRSMLV